MISIELKNIVESIIFASEDEISSKQIKDIIDRSGLRISIAEVEEAVNLLNDEYKISNKSFEILKIAGGFSFATKKEYGRFIGKLFEEKQKKKLSPSALETLAIIAYKQPITRSEMEFIRGVNVDYIVNSLLEKDMITIHGRAETPGRPILYGTTKNFLKVLGLNSIEDLPKLKEINEILKNEEIEGITEADIELFNSVNNPEIYKESEAGHQLELISADGLTDSVIHTESEESNDEVNSDEDFEVSSDEVSLDEIDSNEDNSDEENTNVVDSDKVNPDKIKSNEISSDEDNSDEDDSDEDNDNENISAGNNSGKNNSEKENYSENNDTVLNQNELIIKK